MKNMQTLHKWRLAYAPWQARHAILPGNPPLQDQMLCEMGIAASEASAVALVATVAEDAWAEAWMKYFGRTFKKDELRNLHGVALSFYDRTQGEADFEKWFQYWNARNTNERIFESWKKNPPAMRWGAAMSSSEIALVAAASYPLWAASWNQFWCEAMPGSTIHPIGMAGVEQQFDIRARARALIEVTGYPNG